MVVEISERRRAKWTRSAQLLVPDSRVSGYVIGRSGTNPLMAGLALAGCVVLVIGVLAVLTGALIVPGGIPVLLVFHKASPPRGIVVADRGLALVQRSWWNNHPNKLLALLPHGSARPIDVSGSWVKVQLGHEVVWVASGEEQRLRALLGRHALVQA